MEQRVTSEETIRTNDVHCDATIKNQRAELREVPSRREIEGADQIVNGVMHVSTRLSPSPSREVP
jgi:hypothetical protein